MSKKTKRTDTKAGPYKADWASLKKYPIPEWFRDAKFGIYTHWGPYAVPAFGGEWYPHDMYIKGTKRYQYHVNNFGDPSKFGYKDFIPMFKGEKFNADEWAELYKRAGARFAGPAAQHHDGFAMWDSKVTKWNAARMGPKRDVTGELAQALRKQGLKLVTTFHHAFNWKYYEPSYMGNYDTSDPKYAGLYSQPHQPNTPQSKMFLKAWEAKLKEVIDEYQPDQIWFDFGIKEDAFEPYKKSFLAYYYNQSVKWGKEVVCTHKYHMPGGVGVVDIERGKLDTVSPYLWQTDDSVAWDTWCYTKTMNLKSVTHLVRDLVDTVSKNGILLLNFCPKPDGTFPEEQKALLLGIGDWLKINGEAIYKTRPWKVFKEGDIKESDIQEGDIRFTCSQDGQTVYAICLEWPRERLSIKSMSSTSPLCPEDISAVRMLGVPSRLSWSRDNNALNIKIPNRKSCKHAFAFKITLAGP